MSEELLYLNGKQVDIYPDTISRTIQINSIGDLKDRQANYSNTIKIPRTPENVKTMDLLGVIGDVSLKPYRYVNCKYVVDGIELVPYGTAVIKQTLFGNKDDFELVIYDGNFSIKGALENKNLNDLDFSAYNHNLTLQEYLDSWEYTDGYVYADGVFIDNNTDDYVFENTNRYVDLKSPSFYIHTLFDMIITQAGFTWSGEIQNDVDFNSVLTSMKLGYERTIIEAGDGQNIYNDDFVASVALNQASPFNDTNELDQLLLSGDQVLEFTLDGTFNDSNTGSVKFYISVNGTEEYSFNLTDFSGNISLTPNVSVSGLNQVVTFGFYATSNEVAAGDNTITYNYNVNINIDESTLDSKYVEIRFEDIIGDDAQIDFLKDIMQRYGLIFQKRAFENHLDFIKIEDLLIDKQNAIDWSDKLVSIDSAMYKPNYKRFNYANYKYDSDIEPFANGTMSVDNETLSFAGDLFTSLFTASVFARFNNVTINNLYKLSHWSYDVDTQDETDTIVIDINEDGLRLFKLDYVDETHEYMFSNDGNIRTYNGLRPKLTFDGLDYQQYLDTYYNNFNSSIDRYKLLTVVMLLNLLDIYNIDLLKLYYLEQTGEYYYINKISNHKQSALTKVELVRI